MDGVGEDVEAAGDFLAEGLASKLRRSFCQCCWKATMPPMPPDICWLSAAEAFVDAAAGFFFAEVCGMLTEMGRDMSCGLDCSINASER